MSEDAVKVTPERQKEILDKIANMIARMRVHRLGQEDSEYRDLISFWMKRYQMKFDMVKKGIYIDPPWNKEVLRGNFPQSKV